MVYCHCLLLIGQGQLFGLELGFWWHYNYILNIPLFEKPSFEYNLFCIMKNCVKYAIKYLYWCAYL